ncbi:hypothetical protein [Lactiplantibacillus pentosus]|uniref:hypothetical protein n=1 Tax=Lactiplantibacillus pentosus TaxID=1589 RepID=UPI001E5F5D86|nr:hypothetical protein [Lactiplantibacillus pentosus]
MSMDDIYKFDNLEDAFVAIDNNELTEDAPFNVNNTSCYYIGKHEKLLDGISMLVYKFTLIYAFQAEVEIATTGKRGVMLGMVDVLIYLLNQVRKQTHFHL